MNTFATSVTFLAVVLAAAACSTGSGHPAGADAGLGGRAAGGASASGGSGGGGDTSGTPPACGTFKAQASGAYTTATLHGDRWVESNPESTIGIYAAADDAPVCAKGTIARTATGDYGYGYLAFDVNAVLGTGEGVDADAGTDAGAAAWTAWGSYVPQGDGITVHLDNKAGSNLWLCLQGTNFDVWCVLQVTDGAFYHWSDFADNWGAGDSYAKQPLLSINFMLPDSAGTFDFCVNGFVEAANWCACPGGTCTCPTGASACNGTCVPQPEVNPLDCGTCGKVCTETASCREGECSESAFGVLDLPNSLAIDGGNLYFTQPDAGKVMRVALSGGTPEVIASGQDTPTRIVVAGGTVYWANAGTEAQHYADGSIMKLGAGGPSPLAQGQNNVVSLAVDSKFVYWANAGTSPKYADGAILKQDLALGPSDTPVTLASSRVHPKSIALDANAIYWAEQGTGNWGTFAADGQVLKLALDAATGTAPTRLAQNLLAPMTIAVDATNVYVGGADTVLEIALLDQKLTTLATGQSQPFALAVDATDVYWTDLYSGSLVTAPISGSTPAVTLARGQNYAVGLALSATDIYWATQTENYLGGIQRAPK